METQRNTIPHYFGKCLGKPLEATSLPVRSSASSPTEEINEKIFAYAQGHLPQEGILKVDSQGLIYLELSDRYICELLPLLEKETAEPPPYDVGAHITALLPEELEAGLPAEELHKKVPFTLTGCYSVEPSNWEEMRRIWCLTVEIPQLEELRTKLFLPSHIHNQMFHITFAVEKRFLSLSDILQQRNEEILIVSAYKKTT